MKKAAVVFGVFLLSFGYAQNSEYPAEGDAYLLEEQGDPASMATVIQQAPGLAVTNQTPLGRPQINASALSREEIARIANSIPAMGAEISKAGIFPLIDAEARYYRNPDAAAGAKTPAADYARNPYLQFLYAKDIAGGSERLSHKTNGTTFYNMYGVYNLRLALVKDNAPVPKPSYAKRGEIEFVVFSKLRYAPLNTYGETIRLIFYGVDNKKVWSKEFAFNMKQAESQSFEGGIYSMTLNHLLEQRELEDLRLLFRANQIVFGKMEGVLNSFTFDFRPNASYFYRVFLEYGKSNRYF